MHLMSIVRETQFPSVSDLKIYLNWAGTYLNKFHLFQILMEPSLLLTPLIRKQFGTSLKNIYILILL